MRYVEEHFEKRKKSIMFDITIYKKDKISL